MADTRKPPFIADINGNLRRVKDLAGRKFGRLTVECLLPKDGRRTHWMCVCVCGNRRAVLSENLHAGISLSCGCYRRDLQRINKANLLHGEATSGKNKRMSVEYHCWAAMKDRCLNPKQKCFPKYGGRGITICKEWIDDFENFLKDMGRRPSPSHSLDRKDNDGPYSPGNCRWATKKEQGRNRRTGKLDPDKVREMRRLLSAGVPRKEIAKILGMSRSHVDHVLRGGTWGDVE
jgi:hypothetical protein